jgi:F-box interacting protein
MEILNPKPHLYFHPSPPLHQQQQQQQQHLLLFRLMSKNPKPHIDDINNDKYCELFALHNDDEDFAEYARFDDFLQLADKYKRIYNVVGTCNGLVCFYDNVRKYYLWNPCVGRFVELPSLWTKGAFEVSTGFGFDAKTNDYKVVRVVCYYQNDRPPEVEVYSLATADWRMVTTAMPPKCTLICRETQTFVNGALHWLAFKKNDDKRQHRFIFVFDLGDELFREILLPELTDYKSTCQLRAVYGNSIALFHKKPYLNRVDIWVMKEYGVVSSWTKVLVTDNLYPRSREFKLPWPIGFRRNGQVVLKLMSEQLVSLDLESQETKDLRITSSMFEFVDSYVQSLVLFDKPANL